MVTPKITLTGIQRPDANLCALPIAQYPRTYMCIILWVCLSRYGHPEAEYFFKDKLETVKQAAMTSIKKNTELGKQIYKWQ